MSIKAVLFDLDGTLLPMDMEIFIKAYFKGLSTKLAPFGYDPQMLIKGILAGTQAMITNDGKNTNETVFWNTFCKLCGENARNDEPVFEDFYNNEFQNVKSVCGFDPQAAELVQNLKKRGLRLVVATNPIFPSIATQSRIRWAGLEAEDFEFYTTYENINFCKPNPDYYIEIAKRLNLNPEECLMIGNDVDDDMVASKVGMSVFLLTDNLINKDDVDISYFPNGNYAQLFEYINNNI